MNTVTASQTYTITYHNMLSPFEQALINIALSDDLSARHIVPYDTVGAPVGIQQYAVSATTPQNVVSTVFDLLRCVTFHWPNPMTYKRSKET